MTVVLPSLLPLLPIFSLEKIETWVALLPGFSGKNHQRVVDIGRCRHGVAPQFAVELLGGFLLIGHRQGAKILCFLFVPW